MSKYALVADNGRVVNTVVWDGTTPYTPPNGLTAVPCPDEVNIGWKQDDENWLRPGEAPLEEGEAMLQNIAPEPSGHFDPKPAAPSGLSSESGVDVAPAEGESEPRVAMEPQA